MTLSCWRVTLRHIVQSVNKSFEYARIYILEKIMNTKEWCRREKNTFIHINLSVSTMPVEVFFLIIQINLQIKICCLLNITNRKFNLVK